MNPVLKWPNKCISTKLALQQNQQQKKTQNSNLNRKYMLLRWYKHEINTSITITIVIKYIIDVVFEITELLSRQILIVHFVIVFIVVVVNEVVNIVGATVVNLILCFYINVFVIDILVDDVYWAVVCNWYC